MEIESWYKINKIDRERELLAIKIQLKNSREYVERMPSRHFSAPLKPVRLHIIRSTVTLALGNKKIHVEYECGMCSSIGMFLLSNYRFAILIFNRPIPHGEDEMKIWIRIRLRIQAKSQRCHKMLLNYFSQSLFREGGSGERSGYKIEFCVEKLFNPNGSWVCSIAKLNLDKFRRWNQTHFCFYLLNCRHKSHSQVDLLRLNELFTGNRFVSRYRNVLLCHDATVEFVNSFNDDWFENWRISPLNTIAKKRDLIILMW